MTNQFDPRHPHERDGRNEAPVLDAEGRCLVCSRDYLDELNVENAGLVGEVVRLQTANDGLADDVAALAAYNDTIADARAEVEVLKAALTDLEAAWVDASGSEPCEPSRDCGHWDCEKVNAARALVGGESSPETAYSISATPKADGSGWDVALHDGEGV